MSKQQSIVEILIQLADSIKDGKYGNGDKLDTQELLQDVENSVVYIEDVIIEEAKDEFEDD